MNKQVRGLYASVCKSVGVAYPGSNPGSATAAKRAPEQRKRCAGALGHSPADCGSLRRTTVAFSQWLPTGSFVGSGFRGCLFVVGACFLGRRRLARVRRWPLGRRVALRLRGRLQDPAHRLALLAGGDLGVDAHRRPNALSSPESCMLHDRSTSDQSGLLTCLREHIK
jgi:hypothetical protein